METSSKLTNKELLGKSIVAEARLKSTLRYLNLENFQIGQVHKLWSRVKYNQHSVIKDFVHFKLSVVTYILQCNKARFNQFQVSKLCPLCNLEPESLEHFLLRCSELQRVRDPLCASNWVVVGDIGEYYWKGLGWRRHSTSNSGSINFDVLV